MGEIRDFTSEKSGRPPRETSPRRLAAIVAGDIAGYSRLMELDEEGTHSRVKRIERDLIEPSIAEQEGSSKPQATVLSRFSTVQSKLCGAVSSSNRTWLDATPRCRSTTGSSIGLASILAT
jgi:class 3 adenylate cyclase